MTWYQKQVQEHLRKDLILVFLTIMALLGWVLFFKTVSGRQDERLLHDQDFGETKSVASSITNFEKSSDKQVGGQVFVNNQGVSETRVLAPAVEDTIPSNFSSRTPGDTGLPVKERVSIPYPVTNLPTSLYLYKGDSDALMVVNEFLARWARSYSYYSQDDGDFDNLLAPEVRPTNSPPTGWNQNIYYALPWHGTFGSFDLVKWEVLSLEEEISGEGLRRFHIPLRLYLIVYKPSNQRTIEIQDLVFTVAYRRVNQPYGYIWEITNIKRINKIDTAEDALPSPWHITREDLEKNNVSTDVFNDTK